MFLKFGFSGATFNLVVTFQILSSLYFGLISIAITFMNMKLYYFWKFSPIVFQMSQSVLFFSRKKKLTGSSSTCSQNECGKVFSTSHFLSSLRFLGLFYLYFSHHLESIHRSEIAKKFKMFQSKVMSLYWNLDLQKVND